MEMPSIRRFLPIRKMREPAPVVTVLRLSGVIGQIGPMRRGMSLATLAGPIERAFKPRHLKAVALAVNSPGGSPVQSALIAQRIRALAEEKEVPVFAFAEDVAASGGYWLACAADEIFVDAASIIGSIGVVSGGFGFPELLKKFGVERRSRCSRNCENWPPTISRTRRSGNWPKGFWRTTVRSSCGHPAARRNHHAYVGGLLEHNTECNSDVRLSRRQIRRDVPGHAPPAR